MLDQLHEYVHMRKRDENERQRVYGTETIKDGQLTVPPLPLLSWGSGGYSQYRYARSNGDPSRANLQLVPAVSFSAGKRASATFVQAVVLLMTDREERPSAVGAVHQIRTTSSK
jgi:hypothetical protein